MIEETSNLIILDQKNVQKIIESFKKDGKEKLHVLSDFDRTLTKAKVAGQKSPPVIGQIRDGQHLTPDYAPQAYALYDKYAPLENDPSLTREQRVAKMREWWDTHNKLLVECGLDTASMDAIVAKRTLHFREGALDMFDLLNAHNIPLVIMSAAPGYMIAKYIEQEGRLYDNVHIIANWYEFDEKGKMIKAKEPIIHSLNKHEVMIKNFPAFDKIKDKKNVILLGDNLDDVGMVEGFDHDNLLKIGFLNEDVNKNIPHYQNIFDILITGDGGMDYINKLLQEIIHD